jgi:hypothetical protein
VEESDGSMQTKSRQVLSFPITCVVRRDRFMGEVNSTVQTNLSRNLCSVNEKSVFIEVKIFYSHVCADRAESAWLP